MSWNYEPVARQRFPECCEAMIYRTEDGDIRVIWKAIGIRINFGRTIYLYYRWGQRHGVLKFW